MPRTIVAPTSMHTSLAWRHGWEDAANGRGENHTMNGYQTVRGDSYSEMMYADGYAVGKFTSHTR